MPLQHSEKVAYPLADYGFPALIFLESIGAAANDGACLTLSEAHFLSYALYLLGGKQVFNFNPERLQCRVRDLHIFASMDALV
jgi:hypothetical protein